MTQNGNEGVDNHCPPCPLAGCIIFFRLVLCPATIAASPACLSRPLGRVCGVFHSSSTRAACQLPTLLGDLLSPVPRRLPASSAPLSLPAQGSTQGRFPMALCLGWARLTPLFTWFPSAFTKIKGRECYFSTLFFATSLKEDDIHWWKNSKQTHKPDAIYHRSHCPQVSDNSALFPLLLCSSRCASKLTENRYWSKTLQG